MGFVVPAIEPGRPRGMAAGDYIESSSMLSMVKRDRFLFATRRRLIASLPEYTTTAAATYQVIYGFKASTLATSNGNILVGFTASDDVTVRFTTPYGTYGLSNGGPGCIIGQLTGIPPATWFSVTIEVVSNTGSPERIYGIYMAEAILDDTQLP